MDMPEVKAFNAELSGLYDNKPPISKAKMSAITKGAIKAIKVYKHVVHSVEKFIQKCKPEYKVPGLYVIDSIVRQSRHQFGQDKDVFAPRFAKNMQQTFANLFRCPPEDKRNIIRVLNLWQKNNVFSPQVIQPLMDMADPSHPLHQEIQQQLNNTANGSSLNLSHNTSEKMSPGPAQHSPHMSSPMGGDQFQDEPSGPNLKFNRKLLNDFEYDSEDEQMMDAVPLPPHSSHSHTSHSASHTTHTSSMSHGQSQQQVNQNPTDAMASILTNPEIMRQLHSLQAQMQMMTSIQLPNLMPMMSDMQQMQQNQNQQNLPFLSSQDLQKQNDGKDDMGNNESDIEFVDSGPTVIEIPDANDSRSPSPKSRRHRSRSKSPKRRRRGSRSRSRSPRRRRDRDRERDREREKEREKDREKNYKEREAEREKQKEREKKGLPPIKKENLSVCSTTLWVGHLSKLATPEELSDLFGGVGGVVSIDVVAPRGCAFVVMERRRDAYKALQKLNKHKLHSKEITVAWAPGKGVKGRDWKDYWEAELGVSYLPWAALHARWLLGALSLDAFEDGGACDEDSLPPWLPPRILPKTMMDNMSMMSVGMLPLPPSVPPPLRAQVPPDLSGGAISSPLSGANIPMPPTSMPSMPTMPNMSNMPNMASMPNMSNMGMPRMPPPGMPAGMPTGIPTGMPTGMPAGMTAGMPAGMTASMPPGIRPPSLPSGVPGLQNDAGIPTGGPMIRFPPGMPPQSMPQPGLVPGFLGGLLGVGGLLGGVPVLHLPPRLPQRSNETNQSDDAMDLDTEDMAHPEENNSSNGNDNTPSLPALLPDQMNIKETQRERLIEQIQALLSKPPPAFNASEPPPGFNASEPPPFGQPLPGEDKQDEERKDRDRERRERERDRGDRRERDRGRDRERDNRRERDRGNERGLRGEREREGRDERRDRADRGPAERDRPGRRDRDRGERDRERERFGPNRDNTTRTSREKSPRQASNADNPEKSLQERLWEMANGKAAAARPDAEPERPRAARAAAAAAGPAADGPAEAPRAPLLGAPFRAELRLRMRGPPRPPTAGWMDGPPGPPFGPRFNGMGPPFNRPPFERPPFDGPMYDGPPRFERPPFNRMPFDMNRPPFDGPRPPFDGPRPLFDGPRPPFDGPRPPYDGPRPPFDGPRPPFDGPRPPFDGPRQFDGDRPFDGPPRFDGPPEFFDRNNRRFEEREPPFDERGWSGERDWPERRRERRPRDDEQRFNRPDRRRNFDERPRNDRSDERQRDDKPREEKPKEEKQREDKPREEKQREDKPREEKQREEKPSDDKPREERASRRDKDRKSRWGAAEERAADDPTSAELGADGGAALITAESQLDAEMRPDEEIDERLDSNVDEPCAPEPGHAVPAPTADEIPFPPEFRDESPSPPEFRDENPFPSEARDENPFTPESRDENPSSHESRDENPFTPESRDENPFPSESRDEIPFSSESRGEISSPVESREESPRPSERDSSERSEPGEEPSYAAAIESEPVAKPAIEPMAGLYDTGDAIDTSFGAKAPSEAPEEKAPSTERAPTPPATGSDDIFSQSGEASSVAAPEPREGPA